MYGRNQWCSKIFMSKRGISLTVSENKCALGGEIVFWLLFAGFQLSKIENVALL